MLPTGQSTSKSLSHRVPNTWSGPFALAEGTRGPLILSSPTLSLKRLFSKLQQRKVMRCKGEDVTQYLCNDSLFCTLSQLRFCSLLP